MKLGVLGTGTVGTAIATKLVGLGHAVRMGSRSAQNEKGLAWVRAAGQARASLGTFADAAKFGDEMVFNCTAGSASIEALTQAGAENLRGKILVDVSNPLDFSRGFPPVLSVCNTDSLGEQIQRAFPETAVVKALNTVNAGVMVDPSLVPGEHDMFICGNDTGAKERVRGLLTKEFGWTTVIDLGDLTGARVMEMYAMLWVRLFSLWQTPNFGLHMVR